MGPYRTSTKVNNGPLTTEQKINIFLNLLLHANWTRISDLEYKCNLFVDRWVRVERFKEHRDGYWNYILTYHCDGLHRPGKPVGYLSKRQIKKIFKQAKKVARVQEKDALVQEFNEVFNNLFGR